MTTAAQNTMQLYKNVIDAKAALRDAMTNAPDEPVEDWELKTLDGSPVRLSELFGDHTELLVVHNMGKHCNYCSLWADGFIGIAPHLQERCAFVLCSNDDPSTAAAFAKERGWTYPVVSGHGSEFAKAMGYADDKGNPHPGVSAFHKKPDGSIVRTAHTPFGPGDDFCPAWPLLDLIKGGKADWEPKQSGPSSCSGGGSSCCS